MQNFTALSLRRRHKGIIKAGHGRWKVENERFNNQKNGICRIEHLNSRNNNAMKKTLFSDADGRYPMLSGENVPVNIDSFSNDMVTFANRDDVFTFLVHLGYLGYYILLVGVNYDKITRKHECVIEESEK